MEKFLPIVFLLVLVVVSAQGNFNFWMNGDEVKRILGEIS